MVGQTIRRIFKFFNNNRNWGKMIIAFTFTAVILAGLLWTSSPVKAIGVTLTLPPTVTAGNNYSFTSTVTINTNENVPINSLRLDLTGPTNAYAVFNPDGTITSQSSQFAIAKQGNSTYAEGSRSGYGYGYSSGSNELDISINSGNDQTEVYNDGSNWTWDQADNDTAAGYFDSGTQKWGSGMRFTNINIPQGATITKAYLVFTTKYPESGTGCKTTIIGDKEPDAAAFSNLADYQARRGIAVGGADDTKKTIAQVTWDDIVGGLAQGAQFDSPDISSVIQEIVDQPSWTSGNHLALFWDDHAGRSDQGGWRGAYSYLGSNDSSPILHIEYGFAGLGSYQTSWGYGYGYSGPTTLQYQVTINTSGMQAGNYSAQMSVNVPQPADSSVTKFLSISYPFSITPNTGEGGSVPTSHTLVLIQLAGTCNVDSNGVTIGSSQLTSMNGNIIMNIASGTKLLNSQGQPLTMLSATATTNLPAPPAGSVVISSVEFGPTGATFNPAISVSFKYDPASLPAMVPGSSLYVAWWDGTSWQKLASTVDSQNNEVTTAISHFTSFALIGTQTPVTTTSTTTPTSTITVTPVTTTKTTTTIPATSPSTTKTTQVSTTTLTPITTTSTISTTPSKSSLPLWSWLLIGVVAIFVVAIVVILVRRNK